MIMKDSQKTILFVTPPYHCGVVEVAGTWPPLSFVPLAAQAEKAGWTARIYDAMSLRHDHEKIAETLADRGIDVVVPLLQPRNQFGESCEDWDQALISPTIVSAPSVVQRRQCLGLLQMIPTSPTNQQGRIGVPPQTRIRHEPFLRHVKLPA